MADRPMCRDCNAEMIAAKGFHAILAFEPPNDIDFDQFSPISIYLCGKCGQIKLYLADLSSWVSKKVEVVSYGYRLTGTEEEEPAAREQDRPGPAPGTPGQAPRRSRA